MQRKAGLRSRPHTSFLSYQHGTRGFVKRRPIWLNKVLGLAQIRSAVQTALSGRGRPLLRGGICGLMTTAGGIGHTIPFLIPDFYVATGVAVVVVAIELIVIAYIRNHYMDTTLLTAIFQVVLGGVLVFLAGMLIGSF
jgi:hypothetical protein